ncbi:arginyl-tRNA synthetase [Hokovirus HKV1]|uniref:arginine--tRNA ligase n=1 Tax=Hokovirus HKV1 TaxID=1977638 RepID=A0A1V0SGD0_9VIRU|nr:arginyl-tRNA synthetase [Hokovirus HKV1]
MDKYIYNQINNYYFENLTNNQYELIKHNIIINRSNNALGDFTFTNAIKISKILNVKLDINDIYNYIKNNINIFDINIFSNSCLSFTCNNNSYDTLLLEAEIIINNIKNNTYKTMQNNNILIDYSSPNIAKELHVGYLRSTILGDTIASLFDYFGNNVSRINHIGDVGSNFGRIIAYINLNNIDIDNIDIKELENIYIKSKTETSETFNLEANKATLELQNNLQNYNNDNKIISSWKKICQISKTSYTQIYKKLNINNLVDIGESFYIKFIPDMIKSLAHLLEYEDNRLIYKSKTYYIKKKIDDEFVKEYHKLTLIKSNGCYTYDTTDLAALKYRIEVLNMDQILYVVDTSQDLHFNMLFELAKEAGWKANVKHIKFGLVSDANNKKIKTRDGKNIKLTELLEKSIEYTEKICNYKDNDTIVKIAYSSIKYYDLSILNGYSFDFNKIIALKGNSAPYCMYGYTRILSILNKIDIDYDVLTNIKINMNNYNTLCIIKHVINYDHMLFKTLQDLEINNIIVYVYKLIELFNKFYNDPECLCIDNDLVILWNVKVIIYVKLIIEKIFEILNLNLVNRM